MAKQFHIKNIVVKAWTSSDITHVKIHKHYRTNTNMKVNYDYSNMYTMRFLQKFGFTGHIKKANDMITKLVSSLLKFRL